MAHERLSFVRVRSHLTARITDRTTGKRARALTRDLGVGGLRLTTEDPLPLHAIFDIELSLPDRQMPLRFSAQVMWNNTPRVREKYQVPPMGETGLKFTAIDEKDRTTLMQWVRLNALAPELGER